MAHVILVSLSVTLASSMFTANSHMPVTCQIPIYKICDNSENGSDNIYALPVSSMLSMLAPWLPDAV